MFCFSVSFIYDLDKVNGEKRTQKTKINIDTRMYDNMLLHDKEIAGSCAINC